MPDEHKTVFISYRRSVASYIARAIFMDLRANDYDVFMDVESIDSGQFDRIILNQIEARAHFLVILTPGTLERCAEPGDWLCREIEYAIDKQRNIVPIFVSDFTFAGTEKYLTGKLADLPRYNALKAPHEYFEEAMTRLRTRFLKQPVYGDVKPAPTSDQPDVERKIAGVTAQPAPTEQQLSAEDHLISALHKQILGDFVGALADFDEAIRLNPQDADLFNKRGFARHMNDDYDGAIADYDEAIRLNPQYTDAYGNRGAVRLFKKDINGAMADYQRYIDLGGGKKYSNQWTVETAIRDLQNRLKP